MTRQGWWRPVLIGGVALLGASTASAQTAGLRVQYRFGQPLAPADNHVRPILNVVNGGTSAVPLSELTVRYWYTVDGARPQVYTCDWAQIGGGNVRSRFQTSSSPVAGADGYLELSFLAAAGTLAAGGQTGEIQGRFNKDNWSNYNEADDYSYDPTKASFADWNRITLYRNGTLVWGAEPGGSSTSQTLTVTRAGTGTGTVTSAPAGINCGTTCSAGFPNGTGVTLTAAAAAGSTFTGWSGACTGTGACTVSMTQARAVTATFNAAPGNQTLTVTRAGTGTGTVTSAPAGINCGASCSAAFTNGTSVTLTAAAASGSTFAGWSGACTGTAGCTVSMTQARAVTATFNAASGGAVFRVDPTGRITKNGQLFPVRCGSWFGLEGRHEPSSDPVNPSGAPMEQYIGNTFWAQGGAGTGRTIQQTMGEIAAAGINVIRLPLVPQTLNANDPQGRDPFLKNHASVRVANSRLALEQFIRAADQNDIEIMLDVHSCSNYVGWRKGRLDARPPYVDAEREDYDFTREEYSCATTGNPSSVVFIHPYDQARWLADLRTLAGLGPALGVDNIIGIDIFNEPWDYTWAEWKSLTEAAYQAINGVNSNLLVFVQGISASAGNQDGSPQTITQVPHGSLDTNPNWGENLFEASTNPLTVPRERLVFSPHTYGPSVFVQKMFMDPAQPQCAGLEGDAAGDAQCNVVINPTLLRQGWDEHFGHLRGLGYAVVVGEFGGNLDWPFGQASLRDRERWGYLAPGTDLQWQNAFVDYLVARNIEGCYWSINPESGDTAGWYGHAYDPVSNTSGWGEWRPFDVRKTTLLNRLWGQ
jgi:endoglucanase